MDPHRNRGLRACPRRPVGVASGPPHVPLRGSRGCVGRRGRALDVADILRVRPARATDHDTRLRVESHRCAGALGPRGHRMAAAEIRTRCRRRDSNPHTRRHRNLNPACLPIPPLRRIVQSSGGWQSPPDSGPCRPFPALETVDKGPDVEAYAKARSRLSFATWPVARTLYCASSILPASSRTNVERITPSTTFPYSFFSPKAPYARSTSLSGSESRRIVSPSRSRNSASLSGASGEIPTTV